jgi:hypothetical protein
MSMEIILWPGCDLYISECGMIMELALGASVAI